MKKINLLLLFLCFILSSFLIINNEITKEDRKKAVVHFKETRAFLKQELKGLSEIQLNWKPADSVWSIANCVEHIAVTETGIFEWAMETLNAPVDSKMDLSKKPTDNDIKNKVADRSVKGKAPEIFKPSGKYGNTMIALEAFNKKRDSLIYYIKTTKEDLRSHYAVTQLGPTDVYQLLLLISAHTKRHTLQIVELKSMKGFPSK